MTEQNVALGAEDAAWASLNTPLSVEQLKLFCRDIERLFRINPMLEFKQWQQLEADQFLFSSKNISQETAFELETKLQLTELEDGFKLDYSQGIKSSTLFKIEPSEKGSKLTITEQYQGASEEERKLRLNEVDQSLVVWANYLQKFLVMWHKWSWFAPWRWYMHKAWLPMKPTARRITYMILWISVVEVALIGLGVAIYFAEYAD